MDEDLTKKTDEEIDDILRRAQNVSVDGSLHQRALMERTIRDRKQRSQMGPIINAHTVNNNGFIQSNGSNAKIENNEFTIIHNSKEKKFYK